LIFQLAALANSASEIILDNGNGLPHKMSQAGRKTGLLKKE
jgi:hypothetical protein